MISSQIQKLVLKHNVKAKVVLERIGDVSIYLRAKHPDNICDFINEMDKLRPASVLFEYKWLKPWELRLSSFKWVDKT